MSVRQVLTLSLIFLSGLNSRGVVLGDATMSAALLLACKQPQGHEFEQSCSESCSAALSANKTNHAVVGGDAAQQPVSCSSS